VAVWSLCVTGSRARNKVTQASRFKACSIDGAVSHWRVSRLSYALLAALALHGLLLLTRFHHQPARAALVAQKPQELVEIEDTSVEDTSKPSAPPASNSEPTANRPSSSRSAALARAVTSTLQTDAAGTDATPGNDAAVGDGLVANAAGAGSGQASVGEAPRQINLHLDDGFFMRPASEDLPRVHKPIIEQQLEAALSADDVRRGLARGNVFLGSLNAAAREAGPVRGEALLSVTVGADGSLTGVEFLRGSASDWSSALASFRALAASKRLRVPPGAHGVRVTFSVSAKVQRPSGKEVGSSGFDIGPGALRGTFDVADLGAGAARMVYAHVVSEEVL
jgi:hypothetical protein